MCVHHDKLPAIFVSWTLTINVVRYMDHFQFNQIFKKSKKSKSLISLIVLIIWLFWLIGKLLKHPTSMKVSVLLTKIFGPLWLCTQIVTILFCVWPGIKIKKIKNILILLISFYYLICLGLIGKLYKHPTSTKVSVLLTKIFGPL